MLYAVGFLGALCVVESVKRAYQVAGDAADTLERDLLFLAVAAWALVVDDAGVAALRVAVYRVIYRAVADALLLHAADYLLECVEVLQRVAVKLDVADVAGIGQRMIGRFDGKFFKRVDGEIYRHMEGVGVVVPVGASSLILRKALML